jgi:hypothetical protein
MKSVYTVTKSAPTGDELISIWADEPSAVKEAQALITTLTGFQELHIDEWAIGERSCRHIHAYDVDYDPTDNEEPEDTPDAPVMV